MDLEVIAGGLLHNFVAEFFDYGVGEDFFGDLFDLLFGSFPGHAVQIEDEEFPLADLGNLAKPKRSQGMLDSLTLRIENCAFGHYPYVCFHGLNYTKPRAITRL
jgi:hypothetical protein